MNTPSPADIQAAIELSCCPWCNEPAVQAPKGPKQRCRHCHKRWEITPFGGILEVDYINASNGHGPTNLNGTTKEPPIIPIDGNQPKPLHQKAK